MRSPTPQEQAELEAKKLRAKAALRNERTAEAQLDAARDARRLLEEDYLDYQERVYGYADPVPPRLPVEPNTWPSVN